MIFNYTKQEFSKQVTEEELDKLAKVLKEFIEEYYHYIYIPENEMEAFNSIRHIQFLLETKQYDQLFDNPNELIQTYDEMNQYN